MFPAEARVGHVLHQGGEEVLFADHHGRWLGTLPAGQRGRWLGDRVPPASLYTLSPSWRRTWRGAGAVATLLGWVHAAVVVVVWLDRKPKGGLSC